MSVHPFEFYQAFLRRIQPPPALPNRFLEYFSTRGIAPDIITEAQAIPLTADPSEREIAWYAQHLRSPRCNTKGDPAPCVTGVGFPYFVDVEQYGRSFEFGLATRYHLVHHPLAMMRKSGMGLAMMQKGRLSVTPERIKEVPQLTDILREAKRIAAQEK